MAKYNVKKSLENNMPSLIKLIGNQNISWTTINSGLEKHLAKINKKRLDSGKDEVKAEKTFYSFFVDHFARKKGAIGMFDFFNTTFEQLYNRLSKDELVHVHKIVKFILTNFDSKYLNFIGELATLNAYKSTGKYKLLNIEERIYNHNNVKADLFLEQNDDKRRFLVEVVNIHLENKNLLEESNIKRHIESKLFQKVDKTFFDAPKHDIYIQPVVWTESEFQIKIVSEIYKKNKIDIENVYIPLCYLTYQFSDGSYKHRFEYVNTILEDEKKQLNFIKTLKQIFNSKSNE